MTWTPRTRALAALSFGRPDRIPFRPGEGRESTQARWHAEGLPPDRTPRAYLEEWLGIDTQPHKPAPSPGVDFRMIPRFEEKVLDHKDGHLVVQDWKGNICEIADTFDVTYLRSARDFVTRRWIRCPVETRADWEGMRARYDAADPARFPDDFEARCRAAEGRDNVLSVSFSGVFWQLREWLGFEGLCLQMAEDPEWVDAMAAFWKDFVGNLLARIFEHVVPDRILISEDMAYKQKAMISPAMTRRFCMPAWRQWSAQAYAAGCPLVEIDSDGYIGDLIPLWMESGIRVCSPVEVAAGCDLPAFRQRFGRAMAYTGGIDKRCIAAGGDALEHELQRLGPVIRDGGYIPGCDHGIPADVSWKNYLAYGRRLAQWTGWIKPA